MEHTKMPSPFKVLKDKTLLMIFSVKDLIKWLMIETAPCHGKNKGGTSVWAVRVSEQL